MKEKPDTWNEFKSFICKQNDLNKLYSQNKKQIMNSFLFLEARDFSVRSGDKGQVLFLTFQPRGLTLVLFYSNDCPHCEALIKQFKQLPSMINGCQFAMANVGRYTSIVQMSRSTIVPINYVPDVILFVNGFPYVRYEGASDIEAITTFLLEMNKKIKNFSFMETQNQTTTNNHVPPLPSQQPSPHPPIETNIHIPPVSNSPIPIPEYTIGIPLYGERKKDRVCYLNFNSAYVKAN